MAIDGRYSVKFGKLGLLFIAILAIAMVAEFGYMFAEHGKQELMHQEKLNRIQQIRDSMTANVGVYRTIVGRLSVINRQVLALVNEDAKVSQAFLGDIEKAWNQEYARRVLEVLDYIKVEETKNKVTKLLISKTGIARVAEPEQRYNWINSQLPAPTGADYSDFKAILYHRLDPRFLLFFAGAPASEIRLDQVRWNGEMCDGLPPLRNPKMVKASAANFMSPSERVYGADIDGKCFACPRRILLWHDLASFMMARRNLSAVYDAIDDTMVLFDMSAAGDNAVLGNSGFSYQSGKLLYDEHTKSLWSVADGRPVVGKLVGEKIQLRQLPVQSTTWSQWSKQHPETLVVSPETGFSRDYSETAAESSRTH
jgi:Protein of unknown function (DUF3179)